MDVGEAQTLLQMGPGRDRVTPKERDQPQVHIALQHQGPVVVVLRQAEALLAQLASHAHLCLEQIKPGEPWSAWQRCRGSPTC